MSDGVEVVGSLCITVGLENYLDNGFFVCKNGTLAIMTMHS